MAVEKRRGRKINHFPGATQGDPKERKEAGEFVKEFDTGRNRGGIVPAGGVMDSIKDENGRVDKRKRIYLGEQRLGKRWSEIIMAVNAGEFTWDEFVATLDSSEIARGQLKDKAGHFRGRPPALVPRGFFDACRKELMKRAQSEYEKAYLAAIEAMTKIAKGEEMGAKPADKIKAAQFIIERLEGKTPERVEIKMSDPFADLVEGAIAQVSEDAAIANAQSYLERLGAQEGAEDA